MTATRILAILVAVGSCLAGVAYAATRPGPRAADAGEGSSPLRPRISDHPDAVTSEVEAEFNFTQPGRPAAKARPGPPLVFECKLDDGEWEPCERSVTYERIDRGGHRFTVRAVNHAGNAGPADEYTWRRVRPDSSDATRPPAPTPQVHESRDGSAPPATPPAQTPPAEERPPEEPVEPPPTGLPFTIEQVGTLDDLFPGEPAQTIGVRIENPNPTPISVTSLNASIAAEPPGCPTAENFVLTPAAVSPQAPVQVPAETTLTLAELGIAGPTIAMVELPWSQDACQGAELQIALDGEATG